MAYAWAVGLGADEGAALLKRLGLADAAVDYAVESGAFAHAFQLAQGAAKDKLPEVHLKYAMFLEDEGRFAEAEQEFENAGGCAQRDNCEQCQCCTAIADIADILSV